MHKNVHSQQKVKSIEICFQNYYIVYLKYSSMSRPLHIKSFVYPACDSRIVLIAHVFQSFLKRKGFGWVILDFDIFILNWIILTYRPVQFTGII